MNETRTIDLRIRRQDEPGGKGFWEDFHIESEAGGTVADLLRFIEANPKTVSGRLTSPVVWESGCGDGRCGSCAMIINGKPLLACRARLADFPPAPIILEPLSKFPVVRDLWVDRSAVFDSLKRAEVWLESSEKFSPVPNYSDYARCIHCGICLEACPNFNSVSQFIGPAAIALSASYQEQMPDSPDTRRLQVALMKPGGITGCGSAMNCVKLCPMEIPLTTAIAVTNRRVNKAAWKILKGKSGISSEI
jgi:succinate dehydrogenase / fumarate reductase iron-sulfur subunit